MGGNNNRSQITTKKGLQKGKVVDGTNEHKRAPECATEGSECLVQCRDRKASMLSHTHRQGSKTPRIPIRAEHQSAVDNLSDIKHNIDLDIFCFLFQGSFNCS